mgnify:CR=1 FL=1
MERSDNLTIELFAKNLPVDAFIDSDWTMANARLCDFYKLPEPKAGGFQRVSLKPEDHRGGLLTMGAVLGLKAHQQGLEHAVLADAHAHQVDGALLGHDSIDALGQARGAATCRHVHRVTRGIDVVLARLGVFDGVRECAAARCDRA